MSFISSSRSFNVRHPSQPLSNDEIRAIAPSAFAPTAHTSRSARYAYIPTGDVIDGLRANGFLPVFAKQGATAEVREVGQTFPEIVLVNSHDGTSAYNIMAGMFRLVCLNGMVIADRTDGALKVHHKGDVVHQVIEGSYTVLEESKRALSAAGAWAGVTLNRDERMAMAEAAHVLRFADAEGETDTPIQAAQLLSTRRHDDTGADLWRTFNVVQENVIRGGLTAIGRDAAGRRRRTTTREVKGIDQDVRLNKALWVLGERMAAIKAAA